VAATTTWGVQARKDRNGRVERVGQRVDVTAEPHEPDGRCQIHSRIVATAAGFTQL